MNKFLTDFVSECENRLNMYKSDPSDESLFKLESDLKEKAWNAINQGNIPDEFQNKTYSDLIKIINYVISKEVGAAIYSGAKNFRYYVEQISKDNEVRWYAENLSGMYALILRQKNHYWVEVARVGKLFNTIDEIEKYLADLSKKTGVSLPLETV